MAHYLISVVNNNPSFRLSRRLEASMMLHSVAYSRDILMREIMHFPSPGQMHTDVLIRRGMIAN